jgi:hypothetical protein
LKLHETTKEKLADSKEKFGDSKRILGKKKEKLGGAGDFERAPTEPAAPRERCVDPSDADRAVRGVPCLLNERS